MTTPGRRRTFISFGLATITAAVLALAGWLVAEAVGTGPEAVDLAGIEVLVPTGWVTENPTPGLLAVRSDPADPLARIEIGAPGGASPQAAAADFLYQAVRRLPSFHIAEQDDRGSSVWIEYRFVATDAQGGPVIVAGRVGFVDTTAGLRSLSVETREADFEDIGEVFPDADGGAG